MEIGYIFDIQSYSVHDGPGCRTNVFFAGCPLRCKWCSNPESHLIKPHLLYASKVCKHSSGCTSCANVCPSNSIEFIQGESVPRLDMELCQQCSTFECVSHCPNNALKQCVKEYSVDSLMNILKRDLNNWGSNGGATFTGGEALLQHDFLLQVLHRCKESYIHTAIETSGYAPEDVFLKVLKLIDFAFIDVKHMDSAAHFSATGVHNQTILSNITALVHSGYKGRLVLRQPVINGFNHTKENALQLISFMKELGLFEINLLPFHRLGATKWEQLGKEYEFLHHGDVTPTQLQELQELYLANDIACYIGDNTPF